MRKASGGLSLSGDCALDATMNWSRHCWVAMTRYWSRRITRRFCTRGARDAPATLTTSVPLDDLAARMDVEVLYCPFGPLAFQCEGMRAIVLIADLLHRELPECLPSETRSPSRAVFPTRNGGSDVFSVHQPLEPGATGTSFSSHSGQDFFHLSPGSRAARHSGRSRAERRA